MFKFYSSKPVFKQAGSLCVSLNFRECLGTQTVYRVGSSSQLSYQYCDNILKEQTAVKNNEFLIFLKPAC